MFKTNSEYQKKLLKRWAPVLEKGAPIESVEKKLVMAQVLENTRKEFSKAKLFTEAGPTSVGKTIDMRPDAYNQPVNGNGVLTANDYILPNVVMPMLRRIFPTLMAHELVGVQAMTGPVGYVMALRAVAANPERVGLPTDYEFGYGIDGRANQSRFTGQVDFPADASAPDSTKQNFFAKGDPALNDIAIFLNGPQNGSHSGIGVATGKGEGFATGGGYAQGFAGGTGPAGQNGADLDPSFGHWRNNTYPSATIKFTKRLVAAETRKLGSEWTPEDAEDLEAMQGIDIETEMTNLISYQIGAEIDQQIKESMIRAAWNDTAKVLDVSKLDGLDQMGRIAAMLTFVTKEANEISIATRRGAGNFVLASTTICSCLQQLGTSKLVSDGKTMPSVPASAIGAMTKEGLINDGRQVDNPFDAKHFYRLIKFTGFETGYSLGNDERTFFGAVSADQAASSAGAYQFRSGLVG